MSSPADVAGDILIGAGLCVLANASDTQWTLKVGKSTGEPDQTITMYDTGGQAPNPRWAVDFPTIQAMVRGKPNDYSATWQRARAVRDALLGIDSVTIGSDRWVSVTCPGDVGFVGYDDSQRPMLSVNFRIILEPSITGNRDPL